MTFIRSRKLDETALKKVSSSVFFDRTVGLDVAILLYQSLAVSESDCAHLQFLANRAAFFYQLGATPVFIFDGKHPQEKEAEESCRRERRQKVQEQLENAQQLLRSEPQDQELMDKVEKLKRQCIHVTSKHISESFEFLTALGIPVIEAPGEAEKCLATLQATQKLHLAVSEDTDTLVSGARRWIRCFGDLNNPRLPPLERMATEVRLDGVLKGLELSYDAFVNFCVLCGCDFARKIPRVGPGLAYKIAKAVDDSGGGLVLLSPQSMKRCVLAALDERSVRKHLESNPEDARPETEWIAEHERAKQLLSFDANEEMPSVPDDGSLDDERLWPFLMRYPQLHIPDEIRNRQQRAAQQRKRSGVASEGDASKRPRLVANEAEADTSSKSVGTV